MSPRIFFIKVKWEVLVAIRRNVKNFMLTTLSLLVFYFSITLESVLRAEVPSGEVVNVSYAQQEKRGYGEIMIKRLLVFTENNVYMNSSIKDDNNFSDGYKVGSEVEKIVYGAFIYSHKAEHFLVITSTLGKYLIKTYSIIGRNETKHAQVKRLLLEALIKFDSTFLDKVGHTSCPLPTHENTCTITQGDIKELTEFSGQELCCIKTIKNVSAEQSELIIATKTQIGTVMMNKKSILTTVVQEIDKKIIGVEYWNGYYLLLYDDNSLSICKRSINKLIEKIKHKEFNNLKTDLKVTMFKLPKLEWSGRLPDMFHKEISAVILLVGKCKDKSYIMKYNMFTEQCIGSVLVNSLAEVTTINYGPYDNGPIVLGLNNGTILMYEYYSLELLSKVKDIHKTRIKDIVYEPGYAIVAGSTNLISELQDF